MRKKNCTRDCPKMLEHWDCQFESLSRHEQRYALEYILSCVGSGLAMRRIQCSEF